VTVLRVTQARTSGTTHRGARRSPLERPSTPQAVERESQPDNHRARAPELEGHRPAWTSRSARYYFLSVARISAAARCPDRHAPSMNPCHS
jgi:hypothetical protein